MNFKKFSRLTTYAAFFFTLLLPRLGFAQGPSDIVPLDQTGGNLSPSPTDLSVQFLSNIFGVVDGVLHGSGSQIFGAMFGVFNSAVLAMGMTILGYTLFVAIIKTAHEGEALGKEWSSIWIPMRSAFGFALMLPKASGYSIIQILVMWVVVQGVGAANLVWEAALDYLAKGGAIIQPQQAPITDGIRMTGDILKAETCMFMVEEALQEEAKAQAKITGSNSSQFVPSFLDSVTNPTLKSQPNYDPAKSQSLVLYFPGVLFNADGTEYKNFKGACGSIAWTASYNPNAPTPDPGAKELDDARASAVLQAISGLSSFASQIAKDYGPFPNATNTALKTLDQELLINAVNDYQGIMAPALNSAKDVRASYHFTDFITQAKAEGWIMAGSYYQQLVSLNKKYTLEGSTFPSTTFKYPIPPDKFDVPTIITTDTSLTSFFNTAGDNSLPTFIQTQVTKANEIIESHKKSGLPTPDTGKIFTGQNESDAVGGAIMTNLMAFTNPLGTIIAGFVQLISQTGEMGINPVSPVTAAAILGSGLIGLVALTWLGGAAAMFGITIAVAICPAANPVGTALQVATAWFVPLLTVILVLSFTMGATLTYYIPLIPYILFLFGSIGWLIAVLESMAAAPLVALGIAYPEEHQVLGKAQPAVMLLTNIFIRPSLMVIGFIAGISLSYVGVWLLNRGFRNALMAIVPGTLGWGWLFAPFAILSIYTVLIVEIINRAFSLIHVLPDEVLRWVGGGHRQLGAESSKSEEAIRGGTTGDIKAGGQAIAQSVADERKARGKKEAKLALEEKNKENDGDAGLQQ